MVKAQHENRPGLRRPLIPAKSPRPARAVRAVAGSLAGGAFQNVSQGGKAGLDAARRFGLRKKERR